MGLKLFYEFKKLLIAAIFSFIVQIGYSQYVHDFFPCRDSSGARVEGCFAWSDSRRIVFRGTNDAGNRVTLVKIK